MKFLYCCYGKAGLDSLYQLLNQKECSNPSIFIVTYKDAANHSLIEHIETLGIRYTVNPINDEEAIKEIEEFSPDYLISIHFRDIIRNEVLSLVKQSSVNLHPSLLPDYKGCFSTPWAIINREKKTGITYHIIDEGVDTGNIILQKDLCIDVSDTAFSLFHRLIALAVENFTLMFHLLVRDNFRGIPQEIRGRRYKREVPFGGYLSLSWGKEQIHNFIRALYFPPYEGAKLIIGDEVFEFQNPEEFDNFCTKKGISLS